MLRKFLVNVHRFYAHSHNGTMNYSIMPVIVVSISITSVLAGLDMLLNSGRVLYSLKEIHRLMVTLPSYFLIFLIFLYYRRNLPSDQELRRTKGMWSGVLICILSVVFALIVSIMKN